MRERIRIVIRVVVDFCVVGRSIVVGWCNDGIHQFGAAGAGRHSTAVRDAG